MTEQQKIHLIVLYKQAINEEKDAIENEKLWRNGSSNSEEYDMHQQNIDELEDFICLLEDLIYDLESI